MNYFVQRFVGEFQLLAQLHPVFGGLAGNQITLGNVDFLFFGVAGELENFHPVQQRRRNRIDRVRGGDE